MRVKLNGESLKIVICCHKPSDALPENPDGIFLPVYSGAAINDSASVDEQVQMWCKVYGGGTR